MINDLYSNIATIHKDIQTASKSKGLIYIL